MRQLFEGVFEDDHGLLTRNLAPGKSVYREELVSIDGAEYRVWNPYRSKLAAAIRNGLQELDIRSGMRLLYLGAASGTTVSHVSDIVGANGVVYAVELSYRPMRDLMERVVEVRPNVIPMLNDARRPFEYSYLLEEVDLLYCDIAQPDQTDIALMNARAFLKPEGTILLAVKASSIDSLKPPKEVFGSEVKKLLESGAEVLERIDLSPFSTAHEFVRAKWGSA
jgi:fibrillarin-like pre-rRNA processing protein